ncbi:unnamed protein product [Camellia sinensis]
MQVASPANQKTVFKGIRFGKRKSKDYLNAYNSENKRHFMDKKEPGKEASENVIRESLIAISYHLPEKDLPSEVSPENLHRKDVEGINDGVEEKYRSKLMSIFDSPSPDTKSVPVAKGDNIKD